MKNVSQNLPRKSRNMKKLEDNLLPPYFEKFMETKFEEVHKELGDFRSSIYKTIGELKKSIDILVDRANTNGKNIGIIRQQVKILWFLFGLTALALASHTGGNLIIDIKHVLGF